jgi:hypothetical protein
MRALLFVTLLIAAAGCSREQATPTSPTSTSPAPTPTSPPGPALAFLRIDATSIGLGTQAGLLVGQTHQLIARGSVIGGGQVDVSPVWQVDNRSVLTIDTQGRITGVSNGWATVFATASGASASMAVRVAPDFGGTWIGTWTLMRCDAPQPLFCAQSFPVGSQRPIDLTITPDRVFAVVRMSWLLDGALVTLSPSLVSVGDDGTVSFGERFYDARGFEVPLTAANWRARLTGADTLTARMTLIHGLADGGRTEWEVAMATRARP